MSPNSFLLNLYLAQPRVKMTLSSDILCCLNNVGAFSCEVSFVANPKSISLKFKFSSNTIFSDLISLWIIFLSCILLMGNHGFSHEIWN